MRKVLLSLCLVGLVCPHGVASAREPIVLQPATKWFLDYAEDSCRLARIFGEGKQQVTLFLDQYQPGDDFYITVGGKPLRTGTAGSFVEPMVRFGPGEKEFKVNATTAEMLDMPALIFNSTKIAEATSAEKEADRIRERTGVPAFPSPIGQARESSAKWLHIDGLGLNLTLETGRMDRPLNALRKCAWDTVKLWGLDVEQQKALTRRPVSVKGADTWFRSSDYPQSMIRSGYQGNVNFRLIIDATGKIESCHIQTSTRPKDFDDVVCRVTMKRAKFLPALDAKGIPVRSYWRQTVQFRIGY